MVLKEIKLRSFRNYSRLDWNPGPGIHLLTGENGQGKTNLLESIYFLSTMKSFRGARQSEMTQKGKRGFFIGASFDAQTEVRIKYFWSPGEKKFSLNEEPVQTIRDFLGTLKSVIFSSQDLLLVKGSGRNRRRFLDLLCSQTIPDYLGHLQNYSKALKHRNALLKRKDPDSQLVDTFTKQLVHFGDAIMEGRKSMMPELQKSSQLAINQIIQNQNEPVDLLYKPSVKASFEDEIHKVFSRDLALGSTSIGPHRDDLSLKIKGLDADSHASEGQQRTLALALKYAQLIILKSVSGSWPILLVDDVLGELDSHRRSAFLPLLEEAQSRAGQVFITGTDASIPPKLSNSWTSWSVESGNIFSIKH